MMESNCFHFKTVFSFQVDLLGQDFQHCYIHIISCNYMCMEGWCIHVLHDIQCNGACVIHKYELGAQVQKV